METEVRSLPPSYALYLNGAVFVPIFVKVGGANQPVSEDSPVTIYVPPVLLTGNTIRITWNLVLLSTDEAYEVEFLTPAIKFHEAQPTLHPVGKTQVSIDVGSTRRPDLSGEYGYDIQFRLFRPDSPLRELQVKIKADPTVGVTSDPLEIPTWP